MRRSQNCLFCSLGTGDEETTTIEARYITVLHEQDANGSMMVLRITIIHEKIWTYN